MFVLWPKCCQRRRRPRLQGVGAVLPLLLSLASVGFFGQDALAADAHFVAALADGSRIEGDAVSDWGAENAQPQLAGRKVFDEKNPFRWLINDAQPAPADAAAYVEFLGGDRLPGKIEQFLSGESDPYVQTADALIVEPPADFLAPGANRLRHGRETTSWIRRVVGQPSGREAYRPGMLYFTDGRELRFQSFRWGDGKLTLLQEGKIASIPWSDIAELHLPRRDEWEAYYEQLALLTPGADARLVQLESAEGLTVTTSLLRFQAQSHGDRKKPENWYQIVQPAWSLDPLWVRFEQIRSWRFFQPHEVPLSRIAPLAVEQRSTFGSGWRFRTDRNVHGAALRVKDQLFGWGLGVHGACELTFPIPAGARAFRTRLGLDQSVGKGGCARGLVRMEAADKPLFVSDVLIGCDTIAESGRIALPPQTERARALVLSVDAMAQDRPAGADPFDIRDTLNWLEPEVELDAAVLQSEVKRRLFSALPALARWELHESSPPVELEIRWDLQVPDDPRSRRLWKVNPPFQTVSREMTIGKGVRWLSFCVERTSDKTPGCALHVRIDGRTVADLPIPARVSVQDPEPVSVSVEGFQGRTVSVEVSLIPDGGAAEVNWRGVTLSRHLPGILPLFDEQRNLPDRLLSGGGELHDDTADSYSGRTALRLIGPERFDTLEGLNAPIREVPQVGEYRYMQFAWKCQDAEQITLGLGHNGEFGGDLPRAEKRGVFRIRDGWGDRGDRYDGEGKGRKVGYRYDAGTSDEALLSVLRLSRDIPQEWTLVTRDLYEDFGSFDVTGLFFHCSAGRSALFDRIYLCRTSQDLKRLEIELKAAAASGVVKEVAQPTDCTTIISQIAPQFSSATLGGRIQLVDEFRGRKNVVETSPLAANKPWTLRAPLLIPAGKSGRLEMDLSCRDDGEWQLVVLANGRKLHESTVSKSTLKDEWTTIAVDLGKSNGEPMLLEIQNNTPKWNDKHHAYWSRLEVEMR